MNQDDDDDDVDWSSDASSQVPGGHEGKELAKRLGAGLPRGPRRVNKPVTESVTAI